jgi:hypothetical protein
MKKKEFFYRAEGWNHGPKFEGSAPFGMERVSKQFRARDDQEAKGKAERLFKKNGWSLEDLWRQVE